MTNNYYDCEISDKIIEKYGLGLLQTTSSINNTDEHTDEPKPVGITPFTGYEMFNIKGKVYVRIPEEDNN